MSFGSRIREARKRKGLTQEQLGALIGVAKSTVAGYEKGTSHPDEDRIIGIMSALHIDANYLWQDVIKTHRSNEKDNLFSVEAQRVASLYDTLDEHGKEAVNATLNVEVKRMEAERAKVIDFSAAKKGKQYEDELEDDPHPVPILHLKACAGYGTDLWEDHESEEMRFYGVPEGTKFGIRITGDSMEPFISEDDIVFVRPSSEMLHGAVYVIAIGNTGYCKYLYQADGEVYLCAANPEYDPIGKDDIEDEVSIGGEVLGVYRHGEKNVVSLDIRSMGRMIGREMEKYLCE